MWKKICLFGAGLFASVVAFAQNTVTSASDIYSEIADSGGILDNGIAVFNTVVVIVLAAIGLGLFIKLMRRVSFR